MIDWKNSHKFQAGLIRVIPKNFKLELREGLLPSRLVELLDMKSICPPVELANLTEWDQYAKEYGKKDPKSPVPVIPETTSPPPSCGVTGLANNSPLAEISLS